MKVVTRADLEALSASAAGSARRRQNLNIHPSLDDPIQRLLIAFEPGTYVRPHRHQRVPKQELMVWMMGCAVLLGFDEDGVVQDRIVLNADTPVVEVDVGIWHSLVSLESGTVLMEIKAGPYAPSLAEDFADWSPAEGTPAAAVFETWLRSARLGNRVPRL